MYYKFLVCTFGSEPFLLLFVISNYSLWRHFVPIKSRIWGGKTIKSGEKDKRVNLWIRFVRTVLISWRETPRVRPRYPPTWFLLQSQILKEIDFWKYSSCHCPSTYSPRNPIILETELMKPKTGCRRRCNNLYKSLPSYALMLGFSHRLRPFRGRRSHLTSAIMCKNL